MTSETAAEKLHILNDENEFLCVRCSRHMKTCCQTSEVYATPDDVRRIEEHSGQTEFTEFRAPDDPVYLCEGDDPIWIESIFRPDGTRRVLKRMENGDCTFLGSAGCILPLEVRPVICRLYPYDYTVDGLRDELASGCPMELLPAGQSLLEALDISRDDAVRWHAQLYKEIQVDKEEQPSQ